MTIIHNNVNLLKWYFNKNSNILNDEERNNIFNILTLALYEDKKLFMRIMLYIANTRHDEVKYKIIIQFLGTMFPEDIMANIDMFLKFGKLSDIYYFVSCPNITQKIHTYVKSKAKYDEDFKRISDGELIKDKVKRFIYYKPKFSSNKPFTTFLIKLMDDPIYNGITVSTIYQNEHE